VKRSKFSIPSLIDIKYGSSLGGKNYLVLLSSNTLSLRTCSYRVHIILNPWSLMLILPVAAAKL
jgi:hypothetical protein